MCMTLEWHAKGQRHKQENSNYPKGFVKTATYISRYWKLTMKLKLEEEYSHLRIWSMCNMSWVRYVLRFLLISLVSILFSAVIVFLLIQIADVYNEEKQFEYSLHQW